MNLYPFQQKILKETRGQNHVAYYLEMGLGKTFVGAEKMVQLANVTNLIVCQKSKIKDWIKHFKDNYPDVYVWDLTNKKEFDEFHIHYIGWQKYHGGGIGIGIINYELAWRRKELLTLSEFTLMLDESSLIQNRTAKQSKFILRLDPANVILLSGTPTAGRYENLWTQIHLLGWGISEDTYNAQYVNWKKLQVGWQNPKIVRVVDKIQPYKNVDRLKAKMREHGAVFLKSEEVLDLPEQVTTILEIDISKDYKTFQRNDIVQVDGVELVGDTDLTKRLYSRQLCGQYSAAKLDAFRDLVQSTNDRLIVFYNFTEELKVLLPIVAGDTDKTFSIVNGERKDLTAYERDSDSVTFVQYQAGAMGLNLQKANKIIYFTLPDGRQDLFDQSVKRIHRIGQKQTCFYYILLCKDSIEEEILKTLNIRKIYTDELFREKEE